jgi:HK97 family phage major capsid protein
MTTLGTEYNVEALNKLALDTIGKAEALLAENKIGEAKTVYLELDGIEKRRDELGEIETMRVRLAKEKSRAAAPVTPMRHPEERPMGGERKHMRPGEMFTDLAEYKAMVEQRAYDNPHVRLPEFGTKIDYSLLALKTLVVGNSVSGAGAYVLNDFQPGYVPLLQRPRNFLDLIHRVRTSSDTIDWVQEILFTNNAATVAEATATTGTSGSKPESAVNYQRVTQAVETIAHWIPITTRALADAPQMQDLINGRLLTGLDLTLENQIISGSGTSPDLKGLINQGILTQVWTDTLTAVLKATTKINISGLLDPTDVVMHPTEWETVRLLRENAATGTLGQYLMGPPSQPGPMTIFGLPVTKSLGDPDGTIIVGAFTPQTHALYDREQAMVRLGYINDQFTRNMLTMLAELRAAFAVFMPYGFCAITGAS